MRDAAAAWLLLMNTIVMHHGAAKRFDGAQHQAAAGAVHYADSNIQVRSQIDIVLNKIAGVKKRSIVVDNVTRQRRQMLGESRSYCVRSRPNVDAAFITDYFAARTVNLQTAPLFAAAAL